MIRFEFDWSDLINRGIILAWVILLGVQLWFFFYQNRQFVSTKEGVIKLCLNLILSFVVLMFMLQPRFLVENMYKSGILYGKNVPDSLQDTVLKNTHAEVIQIQDLPLLTLDTLYMVGQDFDHLWIERILSLATPPRNVSWVPYHKPNELASLSWKGLVRHGEKQNVEGAITVSEKQYLKLKSGAETLDSVMLERGYNRFNLETISSAEGRNVVELSLGEKFVDSLHYFSRPMPKVSFEFVLSHPDFESRTLADWLGKQGHTVNYQTLLTRELESSTNINKSDSKTDVFITDEEGAKQLRIKKAIDEGKSVLFYNFYDPLKSIQKINQLVGTRFAIHEKPRLYTSQGDSSLSSFQFKLNKSQVSIPNVPVAYEKRLSKIGVSLMNETYPLMLSGDSVAYKQIWSTIIAHLKSATVENIKIDAPILKGIHSNITLNAFPELYSELNISEDTLNLIQSAINQETASGYYKPLKQGWIELRLPHLYENLEVYIESDTNKYLYKNLKMADFVKLFNQGNTQDVNLISPISKPISPWIWFGVTVFLLTTLWLYDKISK